MAFLIEYSLNKKLHQTLQRHTQFTHAISEYQSPRKLFEALDACVDNLRVTGSSNSQPNYVFSFRVPLVGT